MQFRQHFQFMEQICKVEGLLWDQIFQDYIKESVMDMKILKVQIAIMFIGKQVNKKKHAYLEDK